METTLLEEQLAALAERVKGDVTSVPVAGALTVTPAIAGRLSASIAEQVRVKRRTVFM